MTKLLTICRGNAAAVAEKLGISRQAVAKRIKQAGLERTAAVLRARHAQPGPRVQLKSGSEDPVKEKREIIAALKEHGTQEMAAVALGYGRRRLQKAMERLGFK